jgi:cell division protein FtsI (penicillin-binding protein 3)
MNAPTPALVARPERLRLVGQRRQILAVMHQRLMLGMVYAGIIAIIALRLIGWRRSAIMRAEGRRVDLTPERVIVDRDGGAARRSTPGPLACSPKVIGNKLDLAELAADAGKGQRPISMLRSGRNFYYLAAAPPGSCRDQRARRAGLALEREPIAFIRRPACRARRRLRIDGKGMPASSGHLTSSCATRLGAVSRSCSASPAGSSRRWSMNWAMR